MIPSTSSLSQRALVGLLFLLEFLLLFLDEGRRYARWRVLCVKQKRPQGRHKRWRLGLEKSCEVDLHELWVGWLGLVFQQAHRVLNHHLILESNKLDDLFGYPRAHDLEIDLAHVDFAVKLGRELHRLEEPVLLVGKAPVLLG